MAEFYGEAGGKRRTEHEPTASPSRSAQAPPVAVSGSPQRPRGRDAHAQRHVTRCLVAVAHGRRRAAPSRPSLPTLFTKAGERGPVTPFPDEKRATLPSRHPPPPRTRFSS